MVGRKGGDAQAQPGSDSVRFVAFVGADRFCASRNRSRRAMRVRSEPLVPGTYWTSAARPIPRARSMIHPKAPPIIPLTGRTARCQIAWCITFRLEQ